MTFAVRSVIERTGKGYFVRGNAANNSIGAIARGPSQGLQVPLTKLGKVKCEGDNETGSGKSTKCGKGAIVSMLQCRPYPASSAP